MLLLIPDGPITEEHDLDRYSTIAGASSPYFYKADIPIPQCSTCRSELALLVQVYAPTLQAHRSLYVFYCSSLSCPESNIIARSYCSSDEEPDIFAANRTEIKVETVTQPPAIISDHWGIDDSDEEIDHDLQRLMETFSCQHSYRTSGNGSATSCVGVHLALIDEPDKTSNGYQHELELLKRYELEQETICMNMEDRFMDENYEEPADLAFSKFQKRLSRDSRQCIRYGPGQQPLYMRQLEQVDVPVCSECGHGRQFEMQLMPNLINVLDLGHDWGTITIFTCPRHCIRERLVDEFVFIEAGF